MTEISRSLADQNVLRVSAAAGTMPPMLSDAYKEIARLQAEIARLRIEVERVDPLHRLARKFSGPTDEET